MDRSPPGSSLHGILQARILEWISIPFYRGSSWSWDRTWVSCITGRFFTIWATREAQRVHGSLQKIPYDQAKIPHAVTKTQLSQKKQSSDLGNVEGGYEIKHAATLYFTGSCPGMPCLVTGAWKYWNLSLQRYKFPEETKGGRSVSRPMSFEESSSTLWLLATKLTHPVKTLRGSFHLKCTLNLILFLFSGERNGKFYLSQPDD